MSEFVGDLLFHGVETQNELFVAGDPMDYRVGQRLHILSLLLADFHVDLRLLLQLQSVLTTPRDALAAELQALICLSERPILWVVEAVHRAPCGFVVHNVEFLVQEGVKTNLAVLHTLVQVFEDLFVHMLHSVFGVVFAQLEEITELVLRLRVGVEVHVQLLLQVLPRLSVLSLFRVGPSAGNLLV